MIYTFKNKSAARVFARRLIRGGSFAVVRGRKVIA